MQATPSRPRPRFHDLRVTAVERLTDSAVSIEFAVPEDLVADYAFAPGQYLTLRADLGGQDVRRSYSICLSRRQTHDGRRLRVASARVTDGAMSTWLTGALRVGDTVAVMTPVGDFTCPVRPDVARQHVAVAGGSGITPVLSLVRTALEEEPASRVVLVYANRSPEHVMFRAELTDLEARFGERFRVLHVFSRPSVRGEDGQPRGRLTVRGLTHQLERALPDPGLSAVQEWYLSGPGGLVAVAAQAADEAGADPAHVHTEVFHEAVGAEIG